MTASSPSTGPHGPVGIAGLDHIVLVVADIERSLAWYRDTLGLATEREAEWRAGEVPFPSVRVDPGTVIDLFRGERSGQNMDHFALRVGPDVDLQALADSGEFEVVNGPVDVWGARGQGISVYVRDPDGNTVELKQYEEKP